MTMELKLDLHVHSEKSPDGCMTLDEIVAAAKRAGLNGVAVCDHNLAMTEKAEYEDFLVIPGIEIATEYGHLLGLFVTAPIEERRLHKAADIIHSQGGITVMAHPFEHSTDAERLVPALPLLDGIEVQNSRAERKNLSANKMAREFSYKYSKHIFAGSDAHLPVEVGHSFLKVEAESLSPESVKKALLGGAVSAQGCRSKAIYTAKSQKISRKKQNSGFSLKWLVFSLKCAVFDIFVRGE